MFKYGVLLIELNTEELPTKNLKNIAKSFLSFFLHEFNKNLFFCLKYNYYYTNRKISCLFENFNFYQILNKKYIFIYGPKINIENKINFFKNPLLSWIKKNNINYKKIKYIKYKEKKIFFVKKKIVIKDINFYINSIFHNVLSKLIKSYNIMRWGKKNFVFIRPITNIVVMFNKKILNVNYLGLKSNNLLLGHRFIGKKNIILDHASKYILYLEKYGKIIIDHNIRRYKILCLLNKISFKKKISFNYTNIFLESIISVIEIPFLMVCKFSKKFLFLPKELLIYIIEKFYGFPTFNIKGNLLNYFIIINNIKFSYTDYKNVKNDYEYVIKSKLLDIKILFLNDRNLPLIGYLSKLKNIVFYNKLGNMLDKTRRLLYLSKKISNILKKYNFNIDNSLLFHAVLLSKCDLATSLCKEYKNMKGIIGMHYSLLDYNILNLSLSIKDHYFTKYSYNFIPVNIYSIIISLIDKLDTLVGIFLLYKFKTTNDPYGLRKLSISIFKIIWYNNFCINLYNLIKFNIFLFKNINFNQKNILNIIKFILKRSIIFFLYLGFEKKFINSVINLKIFNFLDLKLRLETIWNIRNTKYFLLFLNLIKRIRNILLKEKFLSFKNSKIINTSYFQYKEEINLYKYIIFLKKKKKKIFINYKYNKLINYFFISIKKVENFFSFVRINVDNLNIKINRLNLINQLNIIFFEFVDFNSLL